MPVTNSPSPARSKLRQRRLKTPAGVTLLESVIAIGVLLVGVVGTLVLVNTTIKLGRVNQDRIAAQNLAREGMELVYSLRNSATYANLHDATTTWDSYLFNPRLIGGQIYVDKYDLGAITSTGDCKQRCDNNLGHCTTESDLDTFAEASRQCDIEAFASHFELAGWNLPQGCALEDNSTHPLFTALAPSYCDYNGSGGIKPDLSDLSRFISDILLNSYHDTFGYPVLSIDSTASSAKLDFYAPGGDTVDANDVWINDRAKVYERNGIFVQNVLTNDPASVLTKFYRTVHAQLVCRNAAGVEDVVPKGSTNNCSLQFGANATKIGVFVTSEVRWPTSTSSTSEKYEVFMYNWLQV